MPRGPRKPSGNRTDLNGPKTQPVQVPQGLTYGEGQKLAQSQQQVPLPGPGAGAGPVAPGGQPMDQLMQQAQQFQPPPVASLGDPTARPNEPVTAGLSSGPGAGPEAIEPAVANTASQALTAQLQALYQLFPTDEFRSLLQTAQEGPQ